MKWVYIGGSLLLVFLVFLFFEYLTHPSKLVNQGKLTYGTVTSVEYNLRNYAVFDYVFYVNGKKYGGKKEGLNLYTEANSLLLHKSFPLMYIPAHPKKNELLVSPEDFKDFNIPYPDSLNDIKAYMMND